MSKVNDITEAAVKSILEANAPKRQVGMTTFAQFEEMLDDACDAFHSGEMPRHKLKKFLLANGFTPETANAEIKQQISVRNFKNETRAREREDAINK